MPHSGAMHVVNLNIKRHSLPSVLINETHHEKTNILDMGNKGAADQHLYFRYNNDSIYIIPLLFKSRISSL